jgi:hypothetical protein
MNRKNRPRTNVIKRRRTSRYSSMFSGFSGEPSPLITVWLQVRVLPGQPMKLIAYRVFCGPLHWKRLENLGNAFSAHSKICIEKPVREVEDPSSAAVDHGEIFIRRFEGLTAAPCPYPLRDLGSSSNIRPLQTIADPVATRWRFLKAKKPPRRAALQSNADLSASCLVAGIGFEPMTFRL